MSKYTPEQLRIASEAMRERCVEIVVLLRDARIPTDRTTSAALFDIALQILGAFPDTPWDDFATLLRGAAEEAKGRHAPKGDA